MLPGLLLAACADRASVPARAETLLPAEPQARAQHCYLVLTLTIDQMAEVDSPGRQAGVVARRGTDELLRARARIATDLADEVLDGLCSDVQQRLEATLAEFDGDGDGQLATAAEIKAFNAHVEACS